MISGNRVQKAPITVLSLIFYNIKLQKGNGKVVPTHAMKAYMGAEVKLGRFLTQHYVDVMSLLPASS
jgi:hypothetical protein